MKKLLSAFISISIAPLFIANTFAAPSDLCAKLPGFWTGETHIKSQAECTQYNGCSHLVMLNATQLPDNKLNIELRYTDGANIKSEQFAISCDNGSIAIPSSLKYTISTSCDSSNHCFIMLDNVRFSGELIKA